MIEDDEIYGPPYSAPGPKGPWFVVAQVIAECRVCGEKFHGRCGGGPKWPEAASEMFPMDATASAAMLAGAALAIHVAEKHPSKVKSIKDVYAFAKAHGGGISEKDYKRTCPKPEASPLRCASNLCNYRGAQFNVALPDWPEAVEVQNP